jgi:hypothetical protein
MRSAASQDEVPFSKGGAFAPSLVKGGLGRILLLILILIFINPHSFQKVSLMIKMIN